MSEKKDLTFKLNAVEQKLDLTLQELNDSAMRSTPTASLLPSMAGGGTQHGRGWYPAW